MAPLTSDAPADYPIRAYKSYPSPEEWVAMSAFGDQLAPVTALAGTDTRHTLSNTVTLDGSGNVGGISQTSISIRKVAEGVIIYGAEGRDIAIVDINGLMIGTFHCDSQHFRIILAKGTYILTVDGNPFKVIL